MQKAACLHAAAVCAGVYLHTAAATVDTGEVLLCNREYVAAAAFFKKKAAGKDSLNLSVHRSYQDAMFAQGDSARREVAMYYRQMLEADSLRESLLYLYGRCLSCEQGMRYFDKALRLSPRYSWALNARGACWFENGDFGKAKGEFLRAIKCDPALGEAYRNLAAVYAGEGNYRRAQKTYRKLIALDRRNGRAYEWLGDMYLAKRSYEYARLAYRKAAAYGITGPPVFFKLGYACFQSGMLREAAAAYRKSIDAGNGGYEVHYNLASVLEQDQMYENAIDHYQIAFDKSGDAAALYSVGNCAVLLGLYSLAIGSYERYLQIYPGHTEALFGLANAYQMKKDYDRAIGLYEEIIAHDSAFAKAYYNLGSIYAYHVRDIDKMKHFWSAFVEKFPNHEDASFIRKETEKVANHR